MGGPHRSKFDERILKRKNLRSNCLRLIREKLLTEKKNRESFLQN